MKANDPRTELTAQEEVESSRKAKADPRDSPNQDKQPAPKADCTVQIPIEAGEACSPFDGKTAPPILNSRPPDDRAS